MNIVPPMILKIRIRDQGGRGFGIWLPFFLLYPLFAVIMLLLLPFLLVAYVVLWYKGWLLPGLLAGIWNVWCETRGMHVEVTNRSGNSQVQVSIN